MKSKSTNEGLTCGNERTSLLTPILPNFLDGGKRERKERGKRKEESFRVRSSHFSLKLSSDPSVKLWQDKRQSYSPQQELRMGTSFMEFRQTSKGMGFLLLVLFFG